MGGSAPTRRVLAAAVALLLGVVVGACRNATSTADGETQVARLVHDHLQSGNAAPLQEALTRQAGRPGGRPSDPRGAFLDTLVRYLAAPEGERGQVAATPLFGAVLREVTAGDARLARRLLEFLYLGEEEEGGIRGADAFARTAVFCAWPYRVASGELEMLVAFMGLRPGDRVADIGAGPGFFTFPFAAAVGAAGHAYAVDINPHMVDFVTRFATEQGIANVSAVLGRRIDIRLPEGSLDHAFMTQTFVDIELAYDADQRRSLFGSVWRSLRPGGRFTVCEPFVEGRRSLTADALIASLAAYGFRDDARALPGSLIAGRNCVRVIRP